MSSRTRLAVTPVVLFVLFAGAAFALAELHLARPGVPAAASVELGTAATGSAVYARTCASCHGVAGVGTSIAPKLAGAPITLAAAKAQIDAGGGVMPAGLVRGQAERDVLAYLATIVAPPAG